MIRFIELPVYGESEIKTELVNVSNIGRIYPNPQNSRKSIIELNYTGVHGAPVYLEVEMPYEALRARFISH